MGLWYPKDSGFELTTFSYVDHAGCLDTRKITSGGIQFLCDKLISWMSRKQDYTAMSSAEAEYMVLSASYAQVRIKQKSQENGQKPDKHGHGNGRARKEPEVFYKKHKGMLGFALEVLTQEAQRPLTHGCHVGNPCVPNLIQRLKNKDSMIRGMEGYDQEERLTEKGTRRFSWML
ncbi:hypothetical protein Tco_0331632 [Tanacetum coccineum]